MNVEDLRKLAHLAQTQNLHTSAAALNITTGALSKTLKKIETQLNSKIFDRVGRNIQINTNGKKFTLYANELINQYDQMLSEFISTQAKHSLNIAGPSVLLDHVLDKLLPHISTAQFEVNLQAVFEGDAINKLKSGAAHLAIVTDDALPDWQSAGFHALPLGVTTFELVAATDHPIHQIKTPTLADINNTFFACPSSSSFCGIVRGVGSDGWPDHTHPRHIAFRCDNFASLLSVIKKHPALAYLPDIAIDEQLSVIKLSDFAARNQERINLVYKPSFSTGWLNQLIDRINASHTQTPSLK
ncbi:LysR family transcriptional regulator [Pseudoalteromonas sp. MMG013]|uniref:LysR family transcriptional regulator n=1 Tax=Pseudoalteromonas sp. MMG013 TaxID=2822687 RepID=UPI001B3949E0|nr:LysR family transcriptional regulator [Pseudoalteromonas sp. MMG013]MBQ4864318.1 LysR family transcriptional regulator [Pseudoalteromonas sp. MMG013]